MIKKGYAIINSNGDVWFTDYDFNEQEMRTWYTNQLTEGAKIAKITLEFIDAVKEKLE